MCVLIEYRCLAGKREREREKGKEKNVKGAQDGNGFSSTSVMFVFPIVLFPNG